MKINMVIERLVLDGLSIPAHHHPVLQTAVETELVRLFTVNSPANGLLTGGAVSRISAGDIQWANESDPGHLGEQIAQAVHGGMTQ